MTNLKRYKEIFSIISDMAFEYDLASKHVSILYKKPDMGQIPSKIPNIIDFIDSSDFIVPGYKSICESLFLELDSGAPRSMQEIQAGKNNNIRWYRITLSKVNLENSTVAFGFIVDITSEKIWHYMSERDSLTGLYNRVAAQGKIHTILSSGIQSQTIHAFFMIDVDYFKRINDTFGHAHGDYVLNKIAATLTSHIRYSDISARIGGDEFVIFFKNIGSKEIAQKKAQELCDSVKKLFSDKHALTLSIGIAMAPNDGLNFEQLYRNADNALYSVKKSGRDNYHFAS